MSVVHNILNEDTDYNSVVTSDIEYKLAMVA